MNLFPITKGISASNLHRDLTELPYSTGVLKEKIAPEDPIYSGARL